MRKYLLKTFFLIPILVFSQKKIEIGIKAGLNLTKHKTNSTDSELEISSNYKTGYLLGVFTNYSFSEKLKIQIEPSFYMKKNEINLFLKNIRSFNTDQIVDANENLIISEYSIELPILFRYDIDKNIYIEGGGQISYILKEKTIQNFQLADYKETNEYSQNISKFENGLIIGTGYYINTKIGINLRYYSGFEDKSELIKNKNMILLGLEYTM